MAFARCVVVLAACLLAAEASWAAAGRFLTVVGDVRIVDAGGQARRVAKGAVLDTGDTVLTGRRALAQVRLTDGGTLSIRGDTELKVDDYTFASQKPSAGRMFLNLLRGGLRSITGLIGKRNRRGYGIRTPHATIGVRGTVHETTVLLKPTGGLQPGTIDIVLEGATVMRTNAGNINVLPRQAGYVTSRNAAPRIIPVPAFLKPRLGAIQPAVQDQRKSKATAERGDKGDAPTAAPTAPRTTTKKVLINPLVSPSTKTLSSPTRTLTSPTKILTSPTTTLSSPTTTLKSPTTRTLTSPTTSTLTSPTKTLTAPKTSTLTSPTTIMRSPTTTTVSPTLTAPKTTTLTSPTTTLRAPTTTTSPKLTAPKLTAPKLTAPLTTTPTR